MISLFLSLKIYFFSCCILGKLVILHNNSRKFYKTLKMRTQTNSVHSKRNSMSKREFNYLDWYPQIPSILESVLSV